MDHSTFAFCLVVPGIITIYCSHGVCCGFKVMWSHESPEHPFEIFLTCVEIPPARNNRLRQLTAASSINSFLIDTNTFQEHILLFIDHFHWRGHVGCFNGHSLDKYASPLITNINSQVNEQANTGLQRINGQIAYMKPENFMFNVQFFFLSITNIEKRGK